MSSLKRRPADHIEHIAQVAGKESVGLGSDFDGIMSTPEGLEDVSKYPYLVSSASMWAVLDSGLMYLFHPDGPGRRADLKRLD